MINSFRRMRTGKPDGADGSGRGRERKRQQRKRRVRDARGLVPQSGMEQSESPESPEARRLSSHGERRAPAKYTVPARVGCPGSRAAAAPAKSTVPARVGCPGSRAAAGSTAAGTPEGALASGAKPHRSRSQQQLEFKGVGIVDNKFVN